MTGRIRTAAALLPLLLAGPFPAPAVAADAALEARVERLERMLNNQSLSDLLLQIQRLQQEVQDLRGQVEVQQYSLQRLEPGSSNPFETRRFDTGSPAPWPSGSAQDGAVRSTPGLAIDARAQPVPPPAQPSYPGGTPPDQAPVSSSGILALPSPETTSGGERDAYRDAFELLKGRDYNGARNAFGDLLTRYPRGQFADNARYWLGEIGYVTQDYPAAMAQLNRLITDYPLSPKVPGAMLKLGYIYDEQGNAEQARATLQEVVARFPDSAEGRLAEGRLERMSQGSGR